MVLLLFLKEIAFSIGGQARPVDTGGKFQLWIIKLVCNSALTGEQTSIYPNVLLHLFICKTLSYGKTYYKCTCII